MTWYLKTKTGSKGPVPGEAIHQLLQDGHLPASAAVLSRLPQGPWQSAEQLAEFSESIATPSHALEKVEKAQQVENTSAGNAPPLPAQPQAQTESAIAQPPPIPEYETFPTPNAPPLPNEGSLESSPASNSTARVNSGDSTPSPRLVAYLNLAGVLGLLIGVTMLTLSFARSLHPTTLLALAMWANAPGMVLSGWAYGCGHEKTKLGYYTGMLGVWLTGIGFISILVNISIYTPSFVSGLMK